jgi:hypothetical protein
MKKHKSNFLRILPMTIMLGSLITFSASFGNACIRQWSDCYNECPSQEEGDQAGSQ